MMWCVVHVLGRSSSLNRVTRQMFTAFGIMLGNVSSLIFLRVPNKPGITGLNWRLMLGSVSPSSLHFISCLLIDALHNDDRLVYQRSL